jgi:hypothetical protein
VLLDLAANDFANRFVAQVSCAVADFFYPQIQRSQSESAASKSLRHHRPRQ